MSLSPRSHVLDNSAKEERRSWNRVPVQIQVFCQRVQGEDELYWSARVTDISRGGIGLLSPHKFELGTIIQIGKADGAEASSRLLQALVVRAQSSPGKKWTLGCAFTKELSESELLGWVEETADSSGCHQDSLALKPQGAAKDHTDDDDTWVIILPKTDCELDFR